MHSRIRASQGAEAAPTPFLVVAGAGYAPVNGRYVHDGTYAGKPRYKQVSGNSIIYFMEGRQDGLESIDDHLDGF